MKKLLNKLTKYLNITQPKRERSNLELFAEQELKWAGYYDKDSDYNGELGPAIMELVEVFAKQGHSGGSASIVRSELNKLLSWQPLTQLTGNADEWVEVHAGMFQNKRCPSVFKDTNSGRTYNIDGKVFVGKNGSKWTSKDSWVDIEFPYYPKTEYVNVP